jgi:hypothetical protein
MFTDYRPANLPPKTASEASRDRAEVDRVHQLYIKKLEREAKRSTMLKLQESDRQLQRELHAREMHRQSVLRENALDEAEAFWLKAVVGGPKWDATKPPSSRLSDTVMRIGIPSRIRGEVWPVCIGNALRITSGLFDINSKRSQQKRLERQQQLQRLSEIRAGEALPAFSSDLGKENTYLDIDADLTRTFPSLAFFQEGCPMNDQLRTVLDAYCFYRADVG